MATLIAGVLWFGAPPDMPTLPGEMLRAMGPWAADVRTEAEGNFQFAVASRTGLAPATTADGQVTVADLDVAWWTEGEAKAGRPVSPGDLSAALASHPVEVPRQIDGEFAYAHWNAAAGTLTLARDGVGVRPLYYIHIPGRCAAFASLLPGLLALRLMQHEVNREVIANLVTNTHVLGESTQFTGIHRVIPGHTTTLAVDHVESRRYWRLECRDPISPRTDRRKVMQTLRDKIDLAVRRRIPAEGPVLTHLSGGLDSSSIAALAARAAGTAGRTIRAYGFGGRPLPEDVPVVDEQPAIDAVLAAYPNIDFKRFCSPDHEVLAHAPMATIFPAFDWPGDLYESVVRDAAATGGTSILAGYGGDEVSSYAGNGGFAEMFVKGRWLGLWRSSVAIARRTGRPAWRMVASEIQRFVLPGILAGLGWRQKADEVTERFERYLQPAWRGVLGKNRNHPRPDTAWLRADRVHNGHMNWIHEQIAQLAGRHGLRYSSPLLDRDVLEFAIRLPPEFMHVDGLMRAGLREAMQDVLPDHTRMRRTKLHFDPACSLVFARESAALQDLVRQLEDGPAADFFRLDLIREELAEMPPADEVIDHIRRSAHLEEQYMMRELGLAQPIFLARYLDAATRNLAADGRS